MCPTLSQVKADHGRAASQLRYGVLRVYAFRSARVRCRAMEVHGNHSDSSVTAACGRGCDASQKLRTVSGRISNPDPVIAPPGGEIASVRVQARPGRLTEVEAAILAIGGCEIHAGDPKGKLMVVVDAPEAGIATASNRWTLPGSRPAHPWRINGSFSRVRKPVSIAIGALRVPGWQ